MTLETKHHGTVSLHTPRANEVIHVLRQRIFSEIYPGMKEKDNPAITVKVPEDRYVNNLVNAFLNNYNTID